MERQLINEVDLPMWHRRLREDNIYFVAGSSSLYIPSQNLKMIVLQKAKPWDGLDGQRVFMTPGEAARTELRRAFPSLKKVGWRRGHIKLFDWQPPMYYGGGFEGRAIGYDLTSAFWQIYRGLWLNVAYPRGYGTLSLKPVADALADWKQARNAVMGLTRARETTAWKDGKRLTLQTTNPFLSPSLWAVVQATLHSIAAVAISMGALYVNTDSYMFDEADGSVEYFTAFLQAYELSYHLECRGGARLVGWNNYKVGTKRTGLYAKYPYQTNRRVDNVQRDANHLDFWFRARNRTGCRGFQI